ncbi:hypothetical protein BH10PAT1_BH10PAT1_6720 [soil metagenome]
MRFLEGDTPLPPRQQRDHKINIDDVMSVAANPGGGVLIFVKRYSDIDNEGYSVNGVPCNRIYRSEFALPTGIYKRY